MHCTLQSTRWQQAVAHAAACTCCSPETTCYSNNDAMQRTHKGFRGPSVSQTPLCASPTVEKPVRGMGTERGRAEIPSIPFPPKRLCNFLELCFLKLGLKAVQVPWNVSSLPKSNVCLRPACTYYLNSSQCKVEAESDLSLACYRLATIYKGKGNFLSSSVQD